MNGHVPAKGKKKISGLTGIRLCGELAGDHSNVCGENTYTRGLSHRRLYRIQVFTSRSDNHTTRPSGRSAFAVYGNFSNWSIHDAVCTR